jgi:hypothetical protein
LHPHLDLSTLIGDVNRLVCESSPANFFASLFYAEYEPATRILKFVNAGHNPSIGVLVPAKLPERTGIFVGVHQRIVLRTVGVLETIRALLSERAWRFDGIC